MRISTVLMQEACVVSWCGGELKLLSDPRARESFGGRYSREDNSRLRDSRTEWVAIVIDHLDSVMVAYFDALPFTVNMSSLFVYACYCCSPAQSSRSYLLWGSLIQSFKTSVVGYLVPLGRRISIQIWILCISIETQRLYNKHIGINDICLWWPVSTLPFGRQEWGCV